MSYVDALYSVVVVDVVRSECPHTYYQSWLRDVHELNQPRTASSYLALVRLVVTLFLSFPWEAAYEVGESVAHCWWHRSVYNLLE